jgi:hypothetical protein
MEFNYTEITPKYMIFQTVLVDFKKSKLEECQIYGFQYDYKRKSFIYMLRCCDNGVCTAFEYDIKERVK